MNLHRNYAARVLCASLISSFVAFSLLHAQDDVTFKAEVDKTTLTLDDTLTLQLTISGGRVSASQPALPPISGFKVYSSGQSQNVSFINGKVSSQVVFSYSLVPQAPGTYTIPSLVLEVEGKTLSSQAITVEVVSGAPPAAQKPSAAPLKQPGTPRKDAFLTTQVDKPTVFVGEPMTLTFRFYSRLRLVSQPSYYPPETTGFLKEDLPPQKQFTTDIDGKKYSVVELKTALFPTSPGKYTIGPASLECRVQDFSVDPFSGSPFDSFFEDFFSGGKPVTLRSDPVGVTVHALPESGRPSQFQGDVGRYTISASMDKKEIKVHEPVTLTITISGDGNIKAVSAPPLPTLNGFKIYETLSSLNVNKDGYRVHGSKVFKTILKPDVTGKLEIPPVSFSYFDPQAKAYKTIQTTPLRMTVQPGTATEEAAPTQSLTREGVKVVSQDIRFIKIHSKLTARQKPFYRSRTFFLLNLAPFGAFLLLWVIKFYRARLSADPRRRAFRQAHGKAQQHRRLAQAALKKGDLTLCYEELHRAFTEFLGGKLGTSPQGLTWDTVESSFRTRRFNDDLIASVRSLWDDLDMSRYAPSLLNREKAEAHDKQLAETIKELERVWKDRSSSKTGKVLLAALLMLIPAGIFAEAVSDKQLFEDGNQAYREGSFTAARDSYEALTARGIGGLELYYNLGNAYYRLGDLGKARLWYERARIEDPLDEDVKHNLNLIRSQTQESGESTDPWLWIEAMWPWFAWGVLLLNIIFFGILVWGLFSLAEWIWWGRWASGLAFAIALGAVFATAPQRNRVNAVAVQPRIEVRTGPGEEYQVGFIVPEGQKVILFDSRPGWREVGVPDKGLKGWAKEGSVQPIEF